MRPKTNIGNVTLVIDKPIGSKGIRLLLGLKRPKRTADARRKRKKVGSGLWVPPGGGTKPSDMSQKHAARRELFEETGIKLPLKSFRKSGILWGHFSDHGRPVWKVHLYTAVTDASKHCLQPNKEYQSLRWFPLRALPFGRMLAGDKKWIPRLLWGEKLSIRLFFNGDSNKLTRDTITRVRSYN